MAEFERETIRQRQAGGRYKGRKKIYINNAEFDELYKRWKNGEIKKRYICKKINVSMSTLDRRIEDQKKKEQIN